mmetsp:Transcript_135579/g.377582  ORF Transcript_135579/g.377582 Transcript_135579/m.377582 type:complete len:260 (+) Transcript_135579:59-838(+)
MASGPDLKTLKAVLIRYGITICDAEDLFVLKDYDIAIIADDSGSMRSRIGSVSRWDELKDTVSQIVDIATCFDTDGVDVHFLNQGTVKGVHSSQDMCLRSAFARPPRGSTPLTETLERVLAEFQQDRGSNFQKPLLLMIATDGIPNGGATRFANCVRGSIFSFAGKVRYQLLPCSDNDSDVAWMNDLDVEFSEVDTTDDYATEKCEVLRAGLAKTFERSDWIMKALLGPVSKKFDAWDDRAHTECLRDARDPCAECAIM